MPEVISELLLYRRAPAEDTVRFRELQHNRHLCPYLEDQLIQIKNSFLKHYSEAYDIQGPHDQGTDVLLRYRSAGSPAEASSRFMAFQLKSFDDLKNKLYLKDIRSQCLQAQAEYRESLDRYYKCASPMDELKGFRARRQRFDTLLERIKRERLELPREFGRVTCPACGYPTLYGDKYEMCPLCEWEDDDQDDPHADEVWGGPNADYSLTEARSNFEKYNGRGGMYRPEHRRDFQRVQGKYPRNQRLMKAYESLIETDTPEGLRAAIDGVREIEGWPDRGGRGNMR